MAPAMSDSSISGCQRHFLTQAFRQASQKYQKAVYQLSTCAEVTLDFDLAFGLLLESFDKFRQSRANRLETAIVG